METLLDRSAAMDQPPIPAPHPAGSGNGSRPGPGPAPAQPQSQPLVLALTPEELQALGLASAPEPNSELAVRGRAVVCPPSGADGVVLELTLTGLARTGDGADNAEAKGGREQEAFFRSLFAGDA